jgi:hypothetical protein
MSAGKLKKKLAELRKRQHAERQEPPQSRILSPVTELESEYEPERFRFDWKMEYIQKSKHYT